MRVTAHSYGSGPLWERVAGVADALQGVAMPLAWQCRIGSTDVGWACCAHYFRLSISCHGMSRCAGLLINNR